MNIDWSAPDFPNKTIYQLIIENLSQKTQPLASKFKVVEALRLPDVLADKKEEVALLRSIFVGEKNFDRNKRKKLTNILARFAKDSSSNELDSDTDISDEVISEMFDLAFPPKPFSVPSTEGEGRIERGSRILIGPSDGTELIENIRHLPKETAVICAIIDEGIPVLHERFRCADGKSTRILAAYYSDGSAAKRQEFYGTGLSKNDIDVELVKIAEGGTDEAAAYKRLGLLDMGSDKPRDLAKHFTHGSVIADLAAGYDRLDVPQRTFEQQPILMVNLPSRELIGLAGANLEAAVKQGIEWIIETAKKLFKNLPENQRKGREHWPIVICLAYGQPAGPKDGTRTLETYIDKVVGDSRQANSESILVFMPAGNSNLDRGHAELATDGNIQYLPLRLQPQDQTPTIIELWTNAIPEEEDNGPPLIEILAPGEKQLVLNVPANDAADGVIDDGKAGLIFYRKVVNNGEVRHRYVIALRPTESLKEEVKNLPPSGLWRIALKWKSGRKIYADVQVDLPVNATNATARKAYFDDPAHERYDNYVRLIDVGDVRANPDEGAIVTQFGSHNAIATGKEVHVISGYSGSDFRPAPYSSTYFETPKAGKSPSLGNNSKPFMAMPSEAGPATFGIIGAGVGSAASQRLNGTSVATALAARKAVEFLLAQPQCNFRAAITPEIKGNEINHMYHLGADHKVVDRKIGEGRAQAPETGRVSRFAPDPDVSERFVKSPGSSA